MTEKEKLKEQIKLLQSKLSFLEEMEKTKSPLEEAFKRVYSYYPEGCETSVWVAFQKGYEQSQKDYKVGEYQEPAPEEEPKTLHKMFCVRGWCEWGDELCDIVKEWMFQYDCDYTMNADYLEGYLECQTVLEEGLQ